jgi:hypothetical protein
MNEILAQEYYGNTMEQYGIALAIIIGGILLVRIFRKRLLNQIKKWTQKTETKLDDYIIGGIESFGLPILIFVVIYFGLSYLTFSEKADRYIDNAMVVVITFYVIRMLSSFIRLTLESFISKQEGGQEKLKQLNGIMLIINVLIWAVGCCSCLTTWATTLPPSLLVWELVVLPLRWLHKIFLATCLITL